MPHIVFLEPQYQVDRFADADPLRGVDLPDSAAIRAEVAARLRDAERPAPPPPRPARRLKIWLPRWVVWLRAMPLP